MAQLITAFNSVMALIEVGGGMILPLFACSILTLALVFEQLWYSVLSARRLRRLMAEPSNLKAIRGMDMISRMIAVLQRHPHASEEEQKRRIELVYNHFERRINWLNTLAALAPLFGLLGTVSGMIRIFAIVATKKPDNPISSLSGGISEALFATGAGLIVAVVAAIAYHYLSSRQEALGEEMTTWYLTWRQERLLHK